MSYTVITMKAPANQGDIFGTKPEGGREMVASALAAPAPLPAPPAEDGSAPGSVVGVVVRAKQKPDGWSILTMDVNGASVAWVGVMPPVHEGQVLMGIGTYETDKYRGGLQLKVDAIVPHVVKTVAGIEAYLAGKGIKGIGKGNAKKIVQHFGLLTVDILDINPDRIAEVKGITPEKAANIAKAWAETRAEAAVAIFLLDHGATPSVARKIVERYGKRARWIVENNPYKLAEDINGVGFKKADEIAKKIGIAHDSPERAQAGTIFVLREQTDKGHCFTLHDDLVRETAKLLTVTYDLVKAAIVQLTADEKVVRCVTGSDGNGDAAIYSKEMHRAETYVARSLLMLRDAPLAPDADSKDKPVVAQVAAAIEAFESDAKITLAPAQREAVEAVAREKVLVITGGPGVGKSLDVDAKVLTPIGYVRIGDISIGDLVICPVTGRAVAVNGVYPQGVLPTFRVEMDDGGSTVCSEDHLWLTRTAKDRATKSEGQVRTLREIRKTALRDNQRAANHSIRFTAPAELAPCGVLPIDPWMLGVYLGDGHLSGVTVRLDKPERDVQERFVAAAPAGDQRGHLTGEDRVSIIGPAQGERSSTSWAIERLGMLGLESHEKFIPSVYLYASVSDRIALLQGLCDTDGTVTGSGKSIEYSTSSERLRDDLVFLVGTLGGRITWSSRQPFYTDARGRHPGRTSYRMYLAFPSGNVVPVSSVKHLAKWDATPNRLTERYIKAITPAGERECVCISVDSPHKLFIADDFIVTHNTAVTKAVLGAFKAAQVPVRLAAPTGRAAKRMAEATGHEAMTIHRMLGFNQETGGFLHTASNPIPSCGLLLLDECFDARQQILTEHGWQMIGRVVNTRAKINVWSRNEETGQLELKPIVRWIKNRAPDKLLKIDAGRTNSKRDGRIIRCTADHKIMTPSGYVRAGDLAVGDKLIVRGRSLSAEQRSIMVGSLLGDGSIQRNAVRNSAQVVLMNGEEQREYIEFKRRAFGDLASELNPATSGYGDGVIWRFSIDVTDESAQMEREMPFVDTHKSGRRRWSPTDEFISRIDAQALAIWYLDNGSVGNGQATIHSQRFSLVDNERLAAWLLTTFGIEASPHPDGKGYIYLRLKTNATRRMFDVIRAFVPSCMSYKIDHCPGYSYEPGKQVGTTVAPIRSIETVPPSKNNPHVYDIEVSDFHNYVAGNIVVSNCSMCDIQLTKDVLAATPTGARVVFVGDVDQLPSVGPGAVLRDVIDSGEIKTVRLTQIFRQAKGSQIIEQAHRINRGEMPTGDTTTSGEFYWVEREEEHAAAEAVIECVTKRIPQRFGISPDNIQVLTPMHKGEAGTTDLNKALQAALNPSSGPELRRGDHTFRIRDRVIHKKNDSQRDVYNGDIGQIVSIEPDNKDRTIICQFDGRLVEYTSKQVIHLKLAYALSTHSSQGGQFDAVVQVLLRRHYTMLSRNLLYTGVTRGKKVVVMIADRSAVKVALSAVRKEDRRTMLRLRLQGGQR